MKTRLFGDTGRQVTEIGLGTWQLGTRWGDPFNEKEAMAILESAYEQGINLIDTADVYNDGKSEETIGKFLKSHRDDFFVVTKSGRNLNPHVAEGYTIENITRFVEGSLRRLQLDCLDMVLLHCPPTPVFHNDELFAGLDRMKQQGKIAHYGVSIEKVEEGIAAMEYNISAIEVIFNMFRLKPTERLFPLAKEKGVGILARVPLASGLLTGKFTADTQFGPDDHRTFNREGAAFDKGETFSGIDYSLGLKAVEDLKQLFGTDDLVPLALRWILMHDAVSCVIPGASKQTQVISNVRAASTPDLTPAQMQGVEQIYDKYFRATVHGEW